MSASIADVPPLFSELSLPQQARLRRLVRSLADGSAVFKTVFDECREFFVASLTDSSLRVEIITRLEAEIAQLDLNVRSLQVTYSGLTNLGDAALIAPRLALVKAELADKQAELDANLAEVVAEPTALQQETLGFLRWLAEAKMIVVDDKSVVTRGPGWPE